MKRQPLTNVDYACAVDRKTKSRHQRRVFQLKDESVGVSMWSVLLPLPDVQQRMQRKDGGLNTFVTDGYDCRWENYDLKNDFCFFFQFASEAQTGCDLS